MSPSRTQIQRQPARARAPAVAVEPAAPTGSPRLHRARQLQQGIGNTRLGRLGREKGLRVQPKLTVGATRDPAEQEADRVATAVMRMPEGACCAGCAGGGSCATHGGTEASGLPLRRVPAAPDQGVEVAPGLEPAVRRATSGGEPLPDQVRAKLQPRFGQDLSNVRIHRDADAAETAQALGAKAYTLGSHIAFNAGQYAPGTASGDRLLAHELTHVAQQERSGVAAIQCYSDAAILAELEQNVGKEDTKAQRLRIEHLTEIFSGLAMGEADELLKRLTARKKGDKLAAEFHYQLSTKSRQKLLGILQKRAATLPLVEYSTPRDDPKYIDNVIDWAECALIIADRYTLKWKGGQKTVYNPEIDWTGQSKALPIVTPIHNSKTSALATAVEWGDVAKGYDAVVTYYQGDAGVILPTWISRETAPITYDLIMGVNAKIRVQGKAAYDFFRGLRNGMIVGAALGGVLRVIVGYSFGGGGGGRGPSAPRVPISDEPLPGGGRGTSPAVPRAPRAEEAPPVSTPPRTAASDPVAIGGRIGDSTKGMKFGKRAKIAKDVSAEKLSQTDAVAATGEASKAAFGRIGGPVRLPNGDVVVPSVQTGPNQPVFVVKPNGTVQPARATIGYELSKADSLTITDLVIE